MSTFNKRSIALISACLLLLLSGRSLAQSDKKNVDSIRARVQRLHSDTDKVGTLLDQVSGFDCDDSSKKILLANDALRLAESIKWNRGIVNSNIVLGRIYMQCGHDRDKAFAYFQANVDLAKKKNDKLEEATALQLLAREYSTVLDQQKAIECYDKVLELHPGIAAEASVLGNIGVTFAQIGDYDKAFKYYDSSQKLFKTKKNLDPQDSAEIAGLHLNMGDMYLVTLNSERALENYRLALGEGAAMKNKIVQIWGLTGIGKAYKLKKDYQHAIENYEQALNVCKENNEFAEQVTTMDELANTYLESWQLNQAQAYADSALSLAEGQHYIGLLSKANLSMGNVYLKENKYELAITYLKKAQDIATQTHSLGDLRDAYESLYKAYKLNNQPAEALTALEGYGPARDSLRNIEKLNELTKMQVGEDFRNKLYADSVKTHIEFGEALKRQRVYTYTGFIGLLLVLSLAFFMYRSYVTQKKYNSLLALEKKRHLAHIEAQTNILSDIADTQAHQIRGPISTILGLVHIFNYDDPADPMNKQVMEWVTSTTEKLDAAVKDVIIRENKLRSEHDEEEQPAQ